jgi:hypothetical protein
MNVMTNQVDQFYVVNSDHNITLKETKKGEVYFTYKGAKGLLRSDLIKPGQVTEVKLTPAAKQRVALKDVVVTLADATYLIPGEDYQVKIVISQFQDMAEDSLYYKYGFVHATAKGTPDASAFYKKMVESLCNNFSREITKFFEFGIKTADGEVMYTDYKVPATAADATATGIIIREVAQDWNLGLMPKTGVNFAVYTDEITVDGDTVIWGDVTSTLSETNVIKNGYAIADMEYFYMGERGDQYRMFARPQDRIPTKLLVNPEEEYDVINIHYYFVDSLGGAQKSEKDITLVIPTGNTVKAATVAATIVSALGVELVTVA